MREKREGQRLSYQRLPEQQHNTFFQVVTCAKIQSRSMLMEFELCINAANHVAVFKRLARRVYRPALLALGQSTEHAER